MSWIVAPTASPAFFPWHGHSTADACRDRASWKRWPHVPGHYHGLSCEEGRFRPISKPAGQVVSAPCPAGGSEQASAMRWASPRSSSFRYRWAWGRSLSTPANPVSAKRRLVRNTVPSATSRAWATRGALHPSSALSRIGARMVTRADSFPARTRCWSPFLYSGVSRTPHFSLTIPPPPINTFQSQGSTLAQSFTSPSKSSLTDY